jgi:hypothetical protein
LFELVDYRYGSEFQALYDTFVETACNFVQVGRYQRFWLNHNGNLRVMVVVYSINYKIAKLPIHIKATPEVSSSHPEWNELFSQSRAEILAMRILGRRIGYFINDIEKGQCHIASIHKNQYSSNRFKYIGKFIC